jgi:DNA-binding NarL/FixJ family response regulator
MPGVDGVQATREIRAAQPGTQIVVLTTYADETSILGRVAGGRARGYLTKDAGIAEISRAVQAAAAGHSLLDAGVQSTCWPPPRASPVPRRRPLPRRLPDELTPREAEVLGLVARGLSNAEIAAHLVVSEATVKTHINHLFSKTGARDRALRLHPRAGGRFSIGVRARHV